MGDVTLTRKALTAEVFAAAKIRGSETIREYAKSIAVESIRNDIGETLLHIVAGFGRTKTTLFLLEQGADVNARDKNGQAPLHNACCHGHYSVASKLIDAGAIVDLRDYKGWSPLAMALHRKVNEEKISPSYMKVIELLIESGANPHLKSLSGKSCLSRVNNKEDRRMLRLRYILNEIRGCEEDKECRQAIVNKFLENKYLKAEDFFEIVRLGDENIELLRLLTTPQLLGSKLDDCDEITPLHRAAGYNHIEAAKLFIEEGAIVDATDRCGRIPLHNAAQYGHVEMIELLIERGSDINKQDLDGFSPLHIAASNKTFTACLKLIELGADINVKCWVGKLPYDIAESDDVREVLKPGTLRHKLELIPSSSDQAIYIDIRTGQRETTQDMIQQRALPDQLMLDSNLDGNLVNNSHTIKRITLKEKDPRFEEVRRRMLQTIKVHSTESGGYFTSYEIMSIELLLHEKVWFKYRLMCQKLEIDYGAGSKNEKLLFHGSNFIDNIETNGFDERYAQRNGMFGAGIYFAEHSSKSNQYTFGWGQGCRKHKDKSCYKCERKMIYAQVALGRSLLSKEAIPHCAHAPPGYSSITGRPESTDNLLYPEYVIYNGDQAYPLFIIRYRIKQ